MNNSINDLLRFVSFTHDVRAIKRSVWVKDEEVFENDSEHGYQLAMVALYVIEHQKLALDTDRAMSMALVHDVLEVHSGDTPIFGSAKDLRTKQAREEAAQSQLKEQWPDLTLMHALIDEYEAKSTPESKFIYALDKLVPILNNYLDDGRNWKHAQKNVEELHRAKASKIAIDPTVTAYYEQILSVLREHPELFGS